MNGSSYKYSKLIFKNLTSLSELKSSWHFCSTHPYLLKRNRHATSTKPAGLEGGSSPLGRVDWFCFVMTLEILALRNLCKKATGVPLFERSELGYGWLFGTNFSQNIESLDFFASFFIKKKRRRKAQFRTNQPCPKGKLPPSKPAGFVDVARRFPFRG